MNIVRYVLNEIRETKNFISYIADLTEGSDDMFDTKTLNLAVSIFSPCVFNLFLRIIESESTLSNKF